MSSTVPLSVNFRHNHDNGVLIRINLITFYDAVHQSESNMPPCQSRPLIGLTGAVLGWDISNNRVSHKFLVTFEKKFLL